VSATDPRIDAYLAKHAGFTELLTHLRALIHRAVPEVDESIKWSRPFFTVDGKILCNIAAFKAHCSFGIWNHEVATAIKSTGAEQDSGMGTFGKLRTRADLPKDAELIAHLKKAARAIRTGETRPWQSTGVKAPRAPLAAPEDLLAALGKRTTVAAAAGKAFAALAPSHQREYLEWILAAKRPETRAKRIATTVETVAQGKRLNWKYE
jgi:uncharacterized protein YdeI (YjbR/CyaY-like superfamily)